MGSDYNGWQNYETWLTNLWLSNDHYTYTYWWYVACDAWRDAKATDIFTRKQVACGSLAERLKDEIEGNNPFLENSACLKAGLYADLLNAALSEINWHEVADAFLEGIPDEVDGEQDEG